MPRQTAHLTDDGVARWSRLRLLYETVIDLQVSLSNLDAEIAMRAERITWTRELLREARGEIARLTAEDACR